ncbi:hypothetical protein [Streptomyces sp. NPDC056949]|uniref:hypothetical protein n=1 Tax=Streptomyces sp. NPDC056949 TaxID=3345976 RepID=UPI00363DE392
MLVLQQDSSSRRPRLASQVPGTHQEARRGMRLFDESKWWPTDGGVTVLVAATGDP